jgi:hypothetical protein
MNLFGFHKFERISHETIGFPRTLLYGVSYNGRKTTRVPVLAWYELIISAAGTGFQWEISI